MLGLDHISGGIERVKNFKAEADILLDHAGIVLAGASERRRLESLEWLVGFNDWELVHGCQLSAQ